MRTIDLAAPSTGSWKARLCVTALLVAGLVLAGLPAAAAPKAQAREADLSVTTSHWPLSIAVGQEVTFELAVYNGGPATATSVRLADAISGPASVLGASASWGSCTGTSPVVCSGDKLASGAYGVVSVQVRATGTGLITSSASVVASQRDPHPSNNTSEDSIEVIAGADLIVTSEDTSSGPVAAITHTITNNGPADASDVSVVVRAFRAYGAVVSTSQGHCAPVVTSADTWNCRPGTLINDQTVSIVVHIASATYGTTVGGFYGTNEIVVSYGYGASEATAKSSQPDPIPWNNRGYASARGSTSGTGVTPCTLPVLRGPFFCSSPYR